MLEGLSNSIKSLAMQHNNSPLASAYLRFLQLARVVQALPEGMEMDANERALLEAVVLRWHENSPMTVREAIGLSQLGSPATLHKRITRLREKDMLGTLNQDGDRRAKFLMPTPRTLEYFGHLGQSMQQVQQNLAA
jgi:DNA-binding MarR family transcriptional regulator